MSDPIKITDRIALSQAMGKTDGHRSKRARIALQGIQQVTINDETGECLPFNAACALLLVETNDLLKAAKQTNTQFIVRFKGVLVRVSDLERLARVLLPRGLGGIG